MFFFSGEKENSKFFNRFPLKNPNNFPRGFCCVFLFKSMIIEKKCYNIMLNNVYRMRLFTQFIDSLTFLFFEKSKHSH